MKSLDVIIVIYNKEISECISLSSLLSSLAHFPSSVNISLTLWNNGPHEIDADSLEVYRCERFQDIKLHNQLDNLPLSQVYNLYLSNVNSDFVAFFDDDTIVGPSYFKGLIDFTLMSPSPSVMIPTIRVDNFDIYPVEFSTRSPIVLSDSLDGYIVSVMSGICVNKAALNGLLKLQSNYMDERFAFYGVDTSFLLNLQELTNLKIISGGILEHDLSSISEDVMTDFRYNERMFDHILMIFNYGRFYKKLHFLKFVFLFFRKALLRMNLPLLKGLVYIFLHNKHPKLEGKQATS